MQINSELPLCMLDENDDLNQYDFILYHLIKSNSQYAEYFKRTTDRFSIMDNSAYEFFIKGETLDIQDYIYTVNEYKPSAFILPDVLMDKEATIKLTRECLMRLTKFKKDMDWCGARPIAVLQGNSPAELLECAQEYLSIGIDYIAIPFHNKFFAETEPHLIFHIPSRSGMELDDAYANGRLRFICKNMDVLAKFDSIHLLGSHNPRESLLYKYMGNTSNIETMDTGYPVKCGIAGYELGLEPHKPNIIIDEFLDTKFPNSTKELIRNNINKFKSWANEK